MLMQRFLQWSSEHLRLLLSVIALIVSLVWIGWSAWRGNHTIYCPGPVATSHAKLDCQACHVQSWQSLQRLFAQDTRQVRLAMDRACVVCHQGLVHQTNEIASAVPNCVSCHREHQGEHGLAKVRDHSCATCHEDLHTQDGPSSFARSVAAMASHPEFQLLSRRQADPGNIRFNHEVHLNPAGVKGGDGKPVPLKCASCHQPMPDGNQMKPIRFQEHCANCHANALVHDPVRFGDQPLPHGVQPEFIRGFLHTRYTQFIRTHPEELGKETKVSRPLPGRSGIQQTTKDEWAWVHKEVEKSDRILFQLPGGCGYCHQVQSHENGWALAPSSIPSRWLAHGKFSHFSHRHSPKPVEGQENCTACHSAPSSKRNSDVLIPGVQKCQECHSEQSQPQSARSDCIECHTYHNHIGGKDKR